MNKRLLMALCLIAAVFMLGTCNDSIYYTISQEVIPIEARIKGGPTNFVIFKDYMYVASGSKLFRYKNENWDEEIPRPGGRIKQLASTGSHLYALCYNDDNPTGSTVLRRYGGDGSSWLEINGDTDDYNTFQSVYSANGELFIGAERNNIFAILHIDNDRIKPLTITGLRAKLCGAVFYETVYFLCTEGHVQNNEKTGGIYIYDADFFPSPILISKTNGVRFTGIINLKDSVAAIDRSGKLYSVTLSGISDDPIATLDRESTGALAIWRDADTNTPRLLLAGRGSLVEGYTYGYMELNITSGVFSGNFSEPGENSLSSITDNNKELYISTIGKESVTHIFQAPIEVDAKMTLFASTQKNGVWSYKVRDGKLQWNAEK
jgi:hypothetical protein